MGFIIKVHYIFINRFKLKKIYKLKKYNKKKQNTIIGSFCLFSKNLVNFKYDADIFLTVFLKKLVIIRTRMLAKPKEI